MFVSCECRVLSRRGLCDELITRTEESYRLWCVVVCDLENLKNEEAMTRVGSQRHSKKNGCFYDQISPNSRHTLKNHKQGRIKSQGSQLHNSLDSSPRGLCLAGAHMIAELLLAHK